LTLIKVHHNEFLIIM